MRDSAQAFARGSVPSVGGAGIGVAAATTAAARAASRLFSASPRGVAISMGLFEAVSCKSGTRGGDRGGDRGFMAGGGDAGVHVGGSGGSSVTGVV